MNRSRSAIATRSKLALLLITLSLATLSNAAPPAGYYDSVDTTSSATLRTTLHNVIKDHTRYPYTSSSTDTWDILEEAQQDPANSSHIIDVYGNKSIAKIGGGTGPYNREHSWPKSYGFPNDGNDNYPYTDCFQLFLCDSDYNSARSNKPFRYCDAGCTEEPTVFNNGQGGGAGGYPGNSNWTSGNFTLGTWEVWAGRRGDIARAQFYLDVRYEGGVHGITGAPEPDLILTDNEALIDSSNTGQNRSVAYMGMLSVLLQWHLQDPVDDWERHRNDIVASYQGNRNPFIDHPEWVDCIFNGVCGGIAAPTGLSAVAGDSAVSLSWNANAEPDLSGYNIYRSTTSGGPYAQLNGAVVNTNAYNDTTVVNGTTYFYVVTAVNTGADESSYSDEASGTPNTNTGGAPAAPVGLNAVANDGSVSLSWMANAEPDLSGYNVYRSTVSGGPYAPLNGALVLTSAYNDNAVVNGTTYFYVVTAANTSAEESPNSGEVSAMPHANTGGNAGPPWINEFHYDNAGGDTGEFFEIAGAAGTDLTNWKVIGYNGNGGVTYDQVNLSGVIPDQGGCMGTLAFDMIGMQNGAPDGLALVDPSDNVIQFISYEGSFVATNGLASGMASTDIGVSEQPAPPIGDSLQLSGTGSAYEDFVWQSAAANTQGNVNTGQSFNGCSSDTTPPDAPTALSAVAANAAVNLSWTGSTASDLDGYNIYRSQTPGGPYSQLNGALVGNNVMLDNTAANCTTYYFVVTAVDTSGNESGFSNEANATPSLSGAAAADCDDNEIPDECQADSDNDGLIDACDACPNDENKIAPGVCGCGVADADSDNDGTPDCNDLCPNDPDKIAPGNCGCNNPDIANGDFNEDGLVNGLDIQQFVTALTSGSPTPTELCHGDFDNLNGVDAADIAPMIDMLLAP
ncbi:MAG: endonuclease [Phycisphaerales bacterium]|nr:endonuclease [Phycisphaerales bacterium]MCB9855020.1 endonuclease [Phycisphaerales bacterium]MCB9863463.1 endonuclease [Phycisphaerales bacterium]